MKLLTVLQLQLNSVVVPARISNFACVCFVFVCAHIQCLSLSTASKIR